MEYHPQDDWLKCDFGPEGLEYVRCYLKSNIAFGKRLGRILLDSCRLEAGVAWGFVPTSAKQTACFEQSLFAGYSSTTQGLSRRWLIEAVLQQGDLGIFLREDALSLRTDGWLSLSRWEELKIVFCEEDVYEYATVDDCGDNFPKLTGYINACPEIGIVSSLPLELPELQNRSALDRQRLIQIAQSASAIALGAWDGEDIVIWEPCTTSRA